MSDSVANLENLPGSFPVAVVMERRVASSQWVDYVWTATGITVGRHPETEEPRLVREEGDAAWFMVGGFEVTLYADECESYYFNLMSDTPRAYVLAHPVDDGGCPEAFHITMSFDEAHAFLEGEDEVFAVDVPPELYRWTEAFVIANYFPEKKTKRKLRDWTAQEVQG